MSQRFGKCCNGVLFVSNSNAQKFDCSSKIIGYQELLKEKKIRESFDIWSEVRKNCPKENEAVLVDLENGNHHIITKSDIIGSIK